MDPKSKLTYTSYLKINELIALQEPQGEPAAQDEMLFIVVHQAYELWFKQILHDFGYLFRALERDDLVSSIRIMDRVCEIFRLVIHQIEILETMTPVSFNQFRSRLNPASGFQSHQFRQLELMSGIEAAEFESLFALSPEWKEELKKQMGKPNLRDVFFNHLKRRGLITDRTPEQIEKALTKVYSDEPQWLTLQDLCEKLIKYDELFWLWRFRHVQMVERMIGKKRGTGGSLGAVYLATTLKKRFFPELWDLRTTLGAGIEYGVPTPKA